MAKFAVAGNKGTASVKSIVNARAAASASARGRVYDYMVGSPATPADNAFDHTLVRSSTAGTGASNTPSPLDVADLAATGFLASDTYTADPTLGVLLLRVPVNQRGTYRWAAQPGGELVWPVTANNGITGALASASAVDFSATLMVDSQ
jgi:hypothetical protein